MDGVQWPPRVCQALTEGRRRHANDQGGTALMNAAYSNTVECARLPKENEKELKTTCSCHGHSPGTTALSIAKKKDHKEIVDILPNEIYSASSRSACQLLSE
ncbi:Hypothetical protein DHA2_152647 [Giardia duodenalis]|uniref:Ankyrin repeat protein n=1 Tax=Giardia intestinalis TaxID=5741 RepID=V6TFP4_GIAIN|nr:Hypothetical protein DHA2_152647 [Giardia intestinalis]